MAVLEGADRRERLGADDPVDRPAVEALRAQRAAIASTPTLVLAPTDAVLHFCLELSCVGRFVSRLRTLCDIAATIERHGENFDWDLFLEQSADYNAERFVYYSLWLARHLVGADVPAEALQRLERSVPRRSLQDSFLKFIIPTAVLQCDGTSVIPGWFMSRTCRDLLSGSGTVAAIKALRDKGNEIDLHALRGLIKAMGS